MAGAEGIPVDWLRGSPFQNYYLPSLILFVVVGGSFLFAAIAVFRRTSFAKGAAVGAVAIVFVWLAVQLSIIGYVSWMQPATAIAGLIVLALARKLPGNSVHPNSSLTNP
jgi:asparagine N-glycosylation enzyme membrane subunit Stt3